MPPPMGSMPPPPGMMFPPGMPPVSAPGTPAMPPAEEIWVENKTPDGKVRWVPWVVLLWGLVTKADSGLGCPAGGAVLLSELCCDRAALCHRSISTTLGHGSQRGQSRTGSRSSSSQS